jgi:PadR family transcriptional regulator PadR
VEWASSKNNGRAQYYSLTRAGKKQLEAELSNWDRLTTAISLVLGQLERVLVCCENS